jgi:sRNA-binding protein
VAAPAATPSPDSPDSPSSPAAVDPVEPSTDGGAPHDAAAHAHDAPAFTDAGVDEPAPDDSAAAAPGSAEGGAPGAPHPSVTAAQTAAALAERFPALFGSAPRPIKLRIQLDIQQRAPGVFTKRALSWFLSRHTTTNAYLKALVQQPHRFDLDGEPAGEISAEHRQAAQDELARRKAIAQAKRRAAAPAGRESGAPRPRAPTDGAGPHSGTGPAAPGGRPGPRTDRPPRERGRDAGRDASRETGRGAPAGARPETRDRGPAAGRPVRPTAGPRPDGPARASGGAVPATRPPRPGTGPAGARPSPGTPPAPPGPSDPAQRERWLLLRAWETTALSKANFCALKRLSETEFDALIAQARQERGAARST